MRSSSIPAPVHFRCVADQRYPAGLLSLLPLPAQRQGRHCPAMPQGDAPMPAPKDAQPFLQSPPEADPQALAQPGTRGQTSTTCAGGFAPKALPVPGAQLEGWPQLPTPQHTPLQRSPEPSSSFPFAPAITAPASPLQACANTEAHLNKLRRHNKSKGNEGLCLGAGESLEFNYIGKPLAAKAQQVPDVSSTDVQECAEFGGRAGSTTLTPVPSTALAQHWLQ